jgi:hypothetical protein
MANRLFHFRWWKHVSMTVVLDSWKQRSSLSLYHQRPHPATLSRLFLKRKSERGARVWRIGGERDGELAFAIVFPYSRNANAYLRTSDSGNLANTGSPLPLG